jgi:hypothetical protein
MAQTFLEYFKILLPNFGFDILLLQKEYQKALRILNPNEQLNLTNWLGEKGLKLAPSKIK